MPQSVRSIRLTDDESTVFAAAADTSNTKNVGSEFNKFFSGNSRTLRELRNGGMSREQFSQAITAAANNAKLLELLPASDLRDELLKNLAEARQIAEAGLRMHDESGA